jgi:hypothetical protein
VYRDLYRRIEKAEKLLERLAPTAPLDPQQARERRERLRRRKIARVDPATPEELAELTELDERFAEEDRISRRLFELLLQEFFRDPPLRDEERQERAELENKLEAIKRAEGPP